MVLFGVHMIFPPFAGFVIIQLATWSLWRTIVGSFVPLNEQKNRFSKTMCLRVKVVAWLNRYLIVRIMLGAGLIILRCGLLDRVYMPALSLWNSTSPKPILLVLTTYLPLHMWLVAVNYSVELIIPIVAFYRLEHTDTLLEYVLCLFRSYLSWVGTYPS